MNDLDDFYKEVTMYYVDNKSTVRKTAGHFKISKSYVHRIVSTYIRDLDLNLYTDALILRTTNAAECPSRGGQASARLRQKGL